MENKIQATMWKSIKSWARNRYQKWPCILFGATHGKNKLCGAIPSLQSNYYYSLQWQQHPNWQCGVGEVNVFQPEHPDGSSHRPQQAIHRLEVPGQPDKRPYDHPNREDGLLAETKELGRGYQHRVCPILDSAIFIFRLLSQPVVQAASDTAKRWALTRGATVCPWFHPVGFDCHHGVLQCPGRAAASTGWGNHEEEA